MRAYQNVTNYSFGILEKKKVLFFIKNIVLSKDFFLALLKIKEKTLNFVC